MFEFDSLKTLLQLTIVHIGDYYKAVKKYISIFKCILIY